MLPLCIILFGIIEYGVVFKDSLTLSSSTRAGARTASAIPNEGGWTDAAVAAVQVQSSALKHQSSDELWLYNANTTTGNPIGAADDKTCPSGSCMRYTWNTATKKFDLKSGGLGTMTACLNKGGPLGMSSIGVKLIVQHQSITGIVPAPIQLSEKTIMQLEPVENCP